MKVTYDPQVDVLYIYIRDEDTPAVDSIELESGISADIDAQGRVLGIEILDASEKVEQESTLGVTFELLNQDRVTT